MKVYFVATIRNIDIEGTTGSRTVGYFLTKEEAIKCVEENWCDLYEAGYYKYAVIEDVEPGLYTSYNSKPIFFKWSGDIKTGHYKKISKPKELEHIFGFTIG